MATLPPWRKPPSPALRRGAPPVSAGTDGPREPVAKEGPAPVGPGARGEGGGEDSLAALVEKSGRNRLLDDGVDGAALGAMSADVAAEYVMLRLARRRKQVERAALLEEVSALLLGVSDDRALRRILLGLQDAGRIVDVYPLELLFRIRERAPDRVPFARYSPFVKNRAQLESELHRVESPIRFQIPLAMRIRAFALEGGGFPGYVFSPGPPAAYDLELGEAGTFTVLLRGELRKEHWLDRIRLKVVDSEPGSA